MPCLPKNAGAKNALQLTTQQAKLNSQNLFNITTGIGRRQQSGLPKQLTSSKMPWPLLMIDFTMQKSPPMAFSDHSSWTGAGVCLVTAWQSSPSMVTAVSLEALSLEVLSLKGLEP
jgi:hypothetical protein